MFNNIFQNKKVLVTGNTGFKGSWLTLWLLKLGANITGISNMILDHFTILMKSMCEGLSEITL